MNYNNSVAAQRKRGSLNHGTLFEFNFRCVKVAAISLSVAGVALIVDLQKYCTASPKTALNQPKLITILAVSAALGYLTITTLLVLLDW